MSEPTKGLAGVVAAETSLSSVNGEKGRLIYRGYDIDDLAEHSTFEETTYLLWHGHLPTKTELEAFTKELAANRAVPDAVLEHVKELKDVPPMGALRTLTSLLGNLAGEPTTTDPEAVITHAKRILPQFATLAAAHFRAQHGKEPVAPRDDLGHAANLLYMLEGSVPSEDAARAMDVALVLHADHGFNASTFSARVTTGTLANLYAGITTALGTLSGPLHGGANTAVMYMLEDIGSVDAVEDWVHDALARKERIMGFGHRVYRVMDPRAVHLKAWSKRMADEAGETKWFDMTAAIEPILKEEKGLNPNVDLYSASLYRALGIPKDFYTPIFAISRLAGWTAHVAEQMADNKLIRPLGKYVGPKDETYVPIKDRK